MFNTENRLLAYDNEFISFDQNGNGVSQLYDEVWDFTAQGENLKTVGFSGIPTIHRQQVKSCLYALIRFEKNKDIAAHISVSRITYWRDTLTYIVKSWGKSDFRLLDIDAEFRLLKSCLNGKYANKTLESICSVINKLNEAGLIQRSVERSSFAALVNDKVEQQHIAIPSAIHAQILEKVTEIIEIYHPFRFAISNAMQQAMELQQTYHEEECVQLNVSDIPKSENSAFRKRLNRRFERLITHDIPNFKFSLSGNFVRSIADFCLIAVALFSGARRKELLYMNPSSYKVHNGIPVLQGFTTKGNEGVPTLTSWVTHELAEKALELAYCATNYARQFYQKKLQTSFTNGLINKDKFNASMREVNSAFISVDMRQSMIKTANATYLTTLKGGFDLKGFEICATEDDVDEFDMLNPKWAGSLMVGGTLPKLNLHSLRRSFAVFLVRNGLGNAQTIRYQYKHKNTKMSEWYGNNAKLMQMSDLLLDAELLAMVEDAKQELAIEAYDDIYNSATLSGGAGDRILNEKQQLLKSGEKIVMTRDEIKRLIKNNSLSIVLLPSGGYCTNPSCERLCGIESFVAENKRCEHEVITDKSAKIMKKQRDRLIVKFRQLNDLNDYAYTRILAGYKQKILMIENDLTKHFVDFEKFDDAIRGLIL